MTPFTPAELNTLRCRLRRAAAGLQQELAQRRHPLTGTLPRDRRYEPADLVRLRQHYIQLAALVDALSQHESLATFHLAASGLLVFAAAELDLLRATRAYVIAQPFSWRDKSRLLRLLELETRFFKLVSAHFQRDQLH
jgi:hypothetical protein